MFADWPDFCGFIFEDHFYQPLNSISLAQPDPKMDCRAVHFRVWQRETRTLYARPHCDIAFKN